MLRAADIGVTDYAKLKYFLNKCYCTSAWLFISGVKCRFNW
jgi:hypothetical protein